MVLLGFMSLFVSVMRCGWLLWVCVRWLVVFRLFISSVLVSIVLFISGGLVG